MKNYTIAVGDLHGRYDLFIKALASIKDYVGENQVTIVFLGDYVDRGPQSALILEALLKGPQETNQTWILLKGNHEVMMYDGLLEGVGSMWNGWLGNGGDLTIESYRELNDDKSTTIPVSHMHLIETMKLFYEDNHRIYVHAWVQSDVKAENTSADMLVWRRYHELDDWTYFDKFIVHGHTPYDEGPMIYKNRANFDTAATWTGRLVLGVFDDQIPGGPIDLIEVTE